jgi:hypothetical protein
MAQASFEVSQARDELQRYLGPRYAVEQNLGVSGDSLIFVVRDRESGNIRVATFRGNVTPREPTGQPDKLQSE